MPCLGWEELYHLGGSSSWTTWCNRLGVVPYRTAPAGDGVWLEGIEEKEIVISVEGSDPTARWTWWAPRWQLRGTGWAASVRMIMHNRNARKKEISGGGGDARTDHILLFFRWTGWVVVVVVRVVRKLMIDSHRQSRTVPVPTSTSSHESRVNGSVSCIFVG